MKPRRILNQPALMTQSLALAAATLLLGTAVEADSGIWTNTAGGNWNTAGNWAGGTVTGGADSIADFNTINLTAPATVSLDAPVTVGSLIFGDATPTADPNNGNGSNGAPYGSSATITGGWVLNNNATPANILTLDASTGQPTITVNNLGTYYSSYAVVSKSLTISAVIAGTDGLTKNGVAKLTLSGANTFSGGLNVTDGILALSGTQGFSGGINISGATSRLEFSDDSNLGNTTSYITSPPPSTIVNSLSLSGGATLFRNGDAGNVGKDTTLNLGTGGASIGYSGYSFLKFGFMLTGDGAFTLNAGNKGLILNGNNSAHTGGFNINTGNLYFSTAQSLPTTGSILVGANGALDAGGAFSTVQGWLGSNRITTTSTGQIALVNTGGGGTATSNTETINMTGYDSLFLGASTAVDLGTNNILRFYGTITPAGNTYRLSGSRGAALGLGNANILTGNNNLIVGNGTFTGDAVNLYASNDFTGTTTVAATDKTKLNLFASNALGTGAVNMLGKSALTLFGGITLGNAITLNGAPDDGAVGALHNSSGANTWTGGITLGGNSRIVAANTGGNSLTLGNIALGNRTLSFIAGGGTGGNITVSGNITGTAGITKTNTAGTLTLGAANTGWSGSTTLQGGTLAIGNNAALGTTGTLTVSSSATIRSTDATARTIGNPLGTFAGSSAVYTFGATSGGTGDLKFSNTTTTSIGTSAARTFQVYNTTEFNMGLSGTGSSINKTGGGTLILNGTNTYSGGTTVTAGTLGGIGTLGTTTILSGGTLAPGNSIGTMNFSQTLSLAGISNFEIDPTLALGLNADLANVTGAITYGGTLNVIYGGLSSDFADGMLFNLFDASSFTGSFAVVNLPTLTGGLSWQNDLATNGSITVVPEPSIAILIGSLGMLCLLRRRG